MVGSHVGNRVEPAGLGRSDRCDRAPARSRIDPGLQDCGQSASRLHCDPSRTYNAFVGAEKSAVDALGGNATYIETVSWFCSRNECPAIINNAPVTYDGTHLVREMSVQLAGVMAESLDPIAATSSRAE